jgi:DNA invertase Pin-like site-specific DNA recombinase
MSAESKVTPEHLKRAAYLYVRQSTLRQVLENTESTQRQYALRKRAAVLGWPEESIVVIDCDLGQSGASAAGREGFQHLVAEVGLGKAGIVLGLEVSRLARNCADWHRLLEICALTGTLIPDEDGLYEPSHYNDRLLLGLKGTMSEAELHVLRARLQGGILSKARRGELKMPLPAGLVYDELDRVCLDPDRQVQESLRHFFCDLCPRRLGLGHGAGVSKRGLEVPEARTGRFGRSRLAGTDQCHRVGHPAQPALRRRVLLRAHAHFEGHRRQDARPAVAAGAVAVLEKGRPPRLHYLERVY